MTHSAISSRERQRLQGLPEYKALATTTLILPAAFAAVPFVFGIMITVLKTEGQAPALAELAQYQGLALVLSFVVTLAIVLVLPGFVSKSLSTRISTTDGIVAGSGSQNAHGSRQPPEMIPYTASLALLESPLVLIFVGCLLGGFTLDTFVVAATAFLFGLAVMVLKVRPIVLEVILQRLHSENPPALR